MVFTLNYLILVVCVLLNVAFVTLLERKILGLSQLRKGPNKVSIWGLLQPISDAAKLFLKEATYPVKSNKFLFYFSPSLGIFLALVLWFIIPLGESPLSFWISAILMLVVLGFGSFPLFLMGWTSNSKYASIGAIRGVAQTISYEISMALVLFFFLTGAQALSLEQTSSMNSFLSLIFLNPVSGYLWVLVCVAETNRTPFDFSEGESELVSGFNVEYGSSGFTLIFLAEYSSILFFSFICSCLIFLNYFNTLLVSLMTVGMAFIWVWIRSTFPRYRYDKLMSLSWKVALPLSLLNLFWLVPFTVVTV